MRPRQNGRHFADNIFKCIFLNENVWILIENFTGVCSEGSNWEYSIIGSDNGLALIRRQAIICTNECIGYWWIYASLGLNESINSFSDFVYIRHHRLFFYIFFIFFCNTELSRARNKCISVNSYQKNSVELSWNRLSEWVNDWNMLVMFTSKKDNS